MCSSDLGISGRRTGTGVRKDRVFSLDNGSDRYGYTRSSYWNSEQVDFDEGGFYVEISRYCVTDCPTESHQLPCSFLTLVKKFNSLVDEDKVDERLISDENIKVYGVKKASIGRYKKSEDWINLWDYMSEYIDKHYSKQLKHIKQQKINEDELSVFSEEDVWLKIYDVIKHQNNDASEFAGVVKIMTKIVNREIPDNLKDVCFYIRKSYEGDIEPITTTSNLDKKHEELMNKYPMLTIIFLGRRGYYSNQDQMTKKQWEYVSEYIELLS